MVVSGAVGRTTPTIGVTVLIPLNLVGEDVGDGVGVAKGASNPGKVFKVERLANLRVGVGLGTGLGSTVAATVGMALGEGVT